MAEAKRTRINAFGISYEGKTGLSTSAVLLGRLSRSWPRPARRRRTPVSRRRTPRRAPGWVWSPRSFAVAAIGWVWTAREMRGMDAGPWTSLGSLGWFLGVWVVMMAAMMFPSVAPTIALYTRVTKGARRLPPWLFAGGYLLTWAGAGLVAYLVGGVATAVLGGGRSSWDNAGRTSLAAITLMVAAVYEVTPLKNVCLAKCRSPLGALLGSWRGGRTGAVRMGSATEPGASDAAGH